MGKNTASELSVTRWTDMLSGWQADHPRFWIGLGNLESRVLKEQIEATVIDKPIYITGLARSGTTILLELLARHPQLASHRYRDFPPILTPWFWNWFVDHAGRDHSTAAERAHGDGIKVTRESPEAFEEVLWMAFFGNLHNPEHSAVLTARTSNPGFEQFYRDHIAKLLLLRRGKRYLSKGNYNLTRLGYLLKLFPTALFLIPVRDPVWHIASLMKQHTRFCREHARDRSLKHHMSRSGHFEFGLDSRPINRGNTEITREIRHLWSSGDDITGWALYWRDVYGYVADLLSADPAIRRAALLIDYDRLCRQPQQVVAQIVDHCGLSATNIDLVAASAALIRHPVYYRPLFSDAQIKTIETVTGEVKQHLADLAG